jgi:hypothetical protein
MSIESMITFYLAIFIFSITPGPGVFALISNSLNNNIKTSYALAFGMSISDVVYLVLAIAIFKWIPGFFDCKNIRPSQADELAVSNKFSFSTIVGVYPLLHKCHAIDAPIIPPPIITIFLFFGMLLPLVLANIPINWDIDIINRLLFYLKRILY